MRKKYYQYFPSYDTFAFKIVSGGEVKSMPGVIISIKVHEFYK